MTDEKKGRCSVYPSPNWIGIANQYPHMLFDGIVYIAKKCILKPKNKGLEIIPLCGHQLNSVDHSEKSIKRAFCEKNGGTFRKHLWYPGK